MQQYRVKALSVGGKNNKVYKSGDIVDAGCFSSSVADLVAQGFLEPITGGKKESVKAESVKLSSDTDTILDAVTDANDVDEQSAGSELPGYDDISKNAIIIELEAKGFVKNKDFKQSQGKQDLYDMLKSII